jgi:uncharacterized protein with HEPN domain
VSEEREQRYLGYILESIELIDQWSAAGRDAFLTDELVQNATLYRLESLSDSTGKLSAGLQERHPQLPWRDVTNFRNRVAHGYLALDLDLVWRVIAVDLPALKQIVYQELDRSAST